MSAGRSSTRICDIPGCGRPHMAKGVCCMHYRRFRLTGSYDPPKLTAADRLWARVIKGGPDECWPWQGSAHTMGYGRLVGPDGKNKVYAHRLAYELAHGPIPDGLVIDHTCHNNSGCPGGEDCPHRRCCNPSHLEAVKEAVNILRGNSIMATNARKDTCSNGHPFDTVWSAGRGYKTRGCKTCHRDGERRRKERLSEAAQDDPDGAAA